ncbi:MAG: hypothetical protein ACKVSF_00780 [Alphaproteobacteria bacterium]
MKSRIAYCFFAALAFFVADARAQVVELPASPHPHGHPMLLYLKSSKPIPDAHAQCLRHLERSTDRLLGYYAAYGIALDATFREIGIQALRNRVAVDWGVTPRAAYLSMRDRAKADIARGDKNLAEAKAMLARRLKGKIWRSDDFANALDLKNFPNVEEFAGNLVQVLGMLSERAMVVNEEAALEDHQMFLRYAECALKNNLPATIAE